jgi:glutaminyl-tRNA synthetase
MTTEPVTAEAGRDFIRDIVQADLDSKKHSRIVTRFPPEPNGYLHIGHGKSIALNFGIAQEFAGRCHLRFDDTNPTREEQEYIDSIQADVHWLGYDWGTDLYYASDYFERLYDWAEGLIRDGHAFVDDQSQEEIRTSRGTLTEPGKNSPFRDRSVGENLDLFRRMKAGEFPNGARVLRAKIDMASGNINLRDPVLYRILHAEHPRTGKTWSIYPSYDYAHGQSDAIEGITHSICTLEFEDHRPLYDWLLDKLPVPSKPHQYEFARLNLTYTLLSKRVLTQLVREGHVAGWDDPRMPTIAGLKRRGVPPAAVREFVKRIGVAKANSVVDVGMLEFCIREELNRTSLRRMAVLRPLKVVIENYREGQVEELEAINHPDDPTAGTRKIAFGRELYIERDDFMENPPKKFFRLSPGTEVRLRYAYFIKCTGVIKNAAGEVVELRCTYDPATKGGNAPDGRKVKATMHWLSAAQSKPAEIRVYNQLFSKPSPDAGNFAADINPQSLEVLSDARVENAIAETNTNDVMQFERQGYFVRDKDSAPDKLVFNRTIGLRDTFAKEVGGSAGSKEVGKTAKPEAKKHEGASANESIQAAEERLAIARLGLKDMDEPTRARSGLYNAVVFGRMVTFSLQNMRNQVAGFDEWYAPISAELKADELMSFIYELRTQIEKTAKQQAGGYVRGGSFNVDEIRALPNKPPNAGDFFIGDTTGGSGWKIVMPDGTIENYYVDLPSSWQVQTGMVLSNAPQKYRQTDARVLVGMYLDKMSTIIDGAKKEFLEG